MVPLTGVQTVEITDSDGFSLAEATTLEATPSDTDAGSLSAEAAAFSVSDTDAGTLSEGVEVGPTASEAAALAEAVALDATLSDTEAAALSESPSVAVTLSADDFGSLSEVSLVSEDAAGAPELSVEIAFVTDPLLPEPAFLRNTVAWQPDGSASVAAGLARFSDSLRALPGVNSMLCEEAVTNLLSANQADVETDTAGFVALGSATLARVTTQSWQGGAALKVDTPGSVVGEGVRTDTRAVVASRKYTASVWALGSGNVRVEAETLAGATPLTVYQSSQVALSSGTWSRIPVTFTADATADGARVRLVTSGTAQVVTFYWDGGQLEERPHATSWHPGGATREGEAVEVPASVVSPVAGSIELWVYVTNEFRTIGHYHTLFMAERMVWTPGQSQVGMWIVVDANAPVGNPGRLNANWRDDSDNRTDIYVDLDPHLPNGWRHIVVTWDVSWLRIYVDGVERGSAASPKLPSEIGAAWIGAGRTRTTQSTTEFSNPAGTYLSDVRISDVVRSAAEVAATAASDEPAPVDAATTYKVPLAAQSVAGVLEYSWTDVTPYVRGFETSRGRQYELDRFEAGTARVTLSNLDRRFDPTHTGSPHYPDVVPGRQIRVRARNQVDGVLYPLFVGFVESWPMTWPGKKDALVTLEAADAFKALARAHLGEWTAVVGEDTPVAWWRFEETGATAFDETANNVDGTWSGSPSLGQPGGLPGVDLAAVLDGVNDYADLGVATALHLVDDFTIEAVIYLDALGSGRRTIAGCTSSGGTTVAWALIVDDDNRLIFRQGPGDASLVWDSDGPALPTETWLHVVCTRDNANRITLIYVDGELRHTERWLGRSEAGAITTQVSQIGRYRGDSGKWYFDGKLSELAVYNTVLAPGRVAAHYQARTVFPADQDAVERAGGILDAIGWPTPRRQLTTAGDNLVAAVGVDSNVLEYLRLLADTEAGQLYISTGGDIVLRGRYYRSQNQGALEATFGDGSGELGYLELRPVYDDTRLLNIVEATREGGEPQVWRDQASVDAFGPSQGSDRSGLLMTTDQYALYNAQFTVGQGATPGVRVEQLTVTGHTASDIWALALGLDIGAKIRVRRRPPGGGDPFTQDCHIEGVRQSWRPDRWQTTWQLSPADHQAYWVLGDAVNGLLGVTTRLTF